MAAGMKRWTGTSSKGRGGGREYCFIATHLEVLLCKGIILFYFNIGRWFSQTPYEPIRVIGEPIAADKF